MKPRKLSARQQHRLLEEYLERLIGRHIAGVQIPVMDLGKIFTAARNAALTGQDPEAAIIATVAAVRCN